MTILIAAACEWAELSLANGDMVFVAQKMVSTRKAARCPSPKDLVKMRRSKAREAGQGRFESEHIIALSCDLRLLSAADLAAQLRTSRQVVVAPDEEGTGTNPMLTRSSAQISSRLGPKSFCSHIREAESLGAKIAVVKRPGLENDLDLPEQSLWIGGSPGRWGPSA